MKSPVCLIHELSDEHYEVSALDLPGFSELRLWLFDFEATGLDTSKERITQIAGVPLQGGQILVDEAFSQLVFPGHGVEISDEVQQLTGITLDMLENEPPLPQAWEAFERAAAGSDLWIGQSVFEFDVPLMRVEFTRHDMSLELPPILDSIVLATALLGEPEGRWSTSALLHHFDVDIGELRRHDALDDVKILGLILLPMLEKIRSEHDDRLRLPEGERLSIKRHAPVRS